MDISDFDMAIAQDPLGQIDFGTINDTIADQGDDFPDMALVSSLLDPAGLSLPTEMPQVQLSSPLGIIISSSSSTQAPDGGRPGEQAAAQRPHSTTTHCTPSPTQSLAPSASMS